MRNSISDLFRSLFDSKLMNTLVIDIGSSSARALLFDSSLHASPQIRANTTYQLHTDSIGEATLDPHSLRLIVEELLDFILHRTPEASISAVAMTCLVGNMLGVDQGGVPTSALYTYADTQSVESVHQLRERVSPDAVHQRTGCRLHTAYHPAKLHWIRETLPEVWRKTTHWVDFAAYLYHEWFGQYVCSYSVASWSGLLNRHNLQWDHDGLRLLDLSVDQFPTLRDQPNFLQGLREPYASRWSALKDVPFFLALGDGAAANIGSGCIDTQTIALTLGTTGAIRTTYHGDILPLTPAIWNYRVTRELQLLGGATSEGGNVSAWLRELLNIDNEYIERILSSSVPDAHGLTVLPMLMGERSPGWNANAVGFIDGLRLSTTASDIVQAALEAVALRLSVITNQLSPYISSDAVVIGGGGALAGSPAWTQVIADSLDRSIHMTDETEVTARGAALLAMNALYGIDLHAFTPDIKRTIEPRPAYVPVMRAALERQTALYQLHYPL